VNRISSLLRLQMNSVTVTARDGHVSQMEYVYLRGSKIRYFIIPDMLKNAPFFKKSKDSALPGRGKIAILRQQGMF
jgi:small nuclear ribonucleoprotein D3